MDIPEEDFAADEGDSGPLGFLADAWNSTTGSVAEAGEDILDSARQPAGEALGGLGGLAADGLQEVGLDGPAGTVREATAGESAKLRHWADTVGDLTSGSSDHLEPNGSAPAPHRMAPDGSLRMVSWNLHHGEGPNGDGAPDQLDAMVGELRRAQGDVYLLQEVDPDHAQHLADALGMDGYYTRTQLKQGDMLLVNPDLEVTENRKVLVNGNIPVGDEPAARAQLRNWAGAQGTEGQEYEPRAAQLLRLESPDGNRITVWNTHLSAVPEEETRLRQTRQIIAEVEALRRPGESVVGGGDLNSRADSPALSALRGQGWSAQGAEIDWFTGDAEMSIDRNRVLRDLTTGLQLSDHPMVVATVRP